MKKILDVLMGNTGKLGGIKRKKDIRMLVYLTLKIKTCLSFYHYPWGLRDLRSSKNCPEFELFKDILTWRQQNFYQGYFPFFNFYFKVKMEISHILHSAKMQ